MQGDIIRPMKTKPENHYHWLEAFFAINLIYLSPVECGLDIQFSFCHQTFVSMSEYVCVAVFDFEIDICGCFFLMLFG